MTLPGWLTASPISTVFHNRNGPPWPGSIVLSPSGGTYDYDGGQRGGTLNALSIAPLGPQTILLTLSWRETRGDSAGQEGFAAYRCQSQSNQVTLEGAWWESGLDSCGEEYSR